MKIPTGRPATLALSGMVTSPHSLASAAGVDVLRAGGSAVDAAIAASAVLAVVYPHMTGLGGDAFWLIHEGKTGKVKYLNGGGRAAASAQLASFTAKGLEEIPLRGIVPATLTVPGAVASWIEAHRAYGRLPLARSLASAIGYARDGFPITERLAGFIKMMAAELAKYPEVGRIAVTGRSTCRSARENHQRESGAYTRRNRGAWLVGLLRGAGRRRDGALCERPRRLICRVGLRKANGHLGRTVGWPLSRRHHLQHTTSDARLHGP